MPDTGAKDLFTMMAVAAEDVAMLLPVLEIIWCAHRNSAPLGRLGMMRLRGYVFTLLDRNLVLGDTLSGVYMHDVVRDYARSMVPAEQLQLNQHAVVKRILAATPTGGWLPIAEPLSAYVQQSLRHHMSEALSLRSSDGDGQSSDNLLALDWLQSDMQEPAASFVVQQAANAVGSVALLQLADEATARGDAWSACLRFLNVSMTDDYASKGSATVDPERAELIADVLLRAVSIVVVVEPQPKRAGIEKLARIHHLWEPEVNAQANKEPMRIPRAPCDLVRIAAIECGHGTTDQFATLYRSLYSGPHVILTEVCSSPPFIEYAVGRAQKNHKTLGEHCSRCGWHSDAEPEKSLDAGHIELRSRIT
jgi:hypothetical protein